MKSYVEEFGSDFAKETASWLNLIDSLFSENINSKFSFKSIALKVPIPYTISTRMKSLLKDFDITITLIENASYVICSELFVQEQEMKIHLKIYAIFLKLIIKKEQIYRRRKVKADQINYLTKNGLRQIAMDHWQTFLPEMYQQLKQENKLEKYLIKAVNRTYDLMQAEIKYGVEKLKVNQILAQSRAWEIIAPMWILKEPEYEMQEEDCEETDLKKNLWDQMFNLQDLINKHREESIEYAKIDLSPEESSHRKKTSR
jgi:hypothetical protein